MLINPAAPWVLEANAVCHGFQKTWLMAGLTSVQREGERKPPRASTEREREECSNSSGVKLLRWKIALTVMMLLFRVARVTLSFTSATPAGAAGLPVSRRAAHCPVSGWAFHLLWRSRLLGNSRCGQSWGAGVGRTLCIAPRAADAHHQGLDWNPEAASGG